MAATETSKGNEEGCHASICCSVWRYSPPQQQRSGSYIFGIFRNLVIAGIIVGYPVAIWKLKYYQKYEVVQSIVTTKVRGVVYSNRTFDPVDYVVPSKESGAFFIMTNVLVTKEQSQGNCSEDPSVKNIGCNSDDYCQDLKGTILPGSNGPITGRCVLSTFDKQENKTVCEISGWCPVQNEALLDKRPVLAGVENSNVFIENHISFPEYGVRKRNFKSNSYFTYDELMECRWKRNDPVNKYCPVFDIKTIAKEAGFEFENLIEKGAVLQIVIKWNCNLDKSVDDCLPEYTFRRLDECDITFTNSFTFRFASHYDKGKTLYRNLYKAHGVLFLITVEGRAGKINARRLLVQIASGFTYIGTTIAVCSFVMSNYRSFFRCLRCSCCCPCWKNCWKYCLFCCHKREITVAVDYAESTPHSEKEGDKCCCVEKNLNNGKKTKQKKDGQEETKLDEEVTTKKDGDGNENNRDEAVTTKEDGDGNENNRDEAVTTKEDGDGTENNVPVT